MIGGVIAPGEARRILRGESPRRVGVSHPPVSSLASVEESKDEQDRRSVDKESCRLLRQAQDRLRTGSGMTVRPEELVQLRDKLVADGDCF